MMADRASSAREGQVLPEVAREAGRRQLLTTEEMLCDWLAGAPPGQQFEYYRGLLAYDRMPSAEVLQPHDRVGLVALAKRAMQAAEDGRVALVQRKHGESDYSYIAIKSCPSRLRRDASAVPTNGACRASRKQVLRPVDARKRLPDPDLHVQLITGPAVSESSR